MVVRRSRMGWVLLLPLAIALSGCPFSPEKGKDDPTPPDTEYQPQTSITNVLANLRQSYIDMNYDEYEKLLDDAYVFVFDPDDVGEETDFKDEWPRGDDLASARNMFGKQPNADGRVVDAITLEFVAGSAETSPVNPDWQRVILSAVELSLETTDQQGDKWFLETPGNYQAYLDFIETSEIHEESGKTIWKIVRWEDKPSQKKNLIAAN